MVSIIVPRCFLRYLGRKDMKARQINIGILAHVDAGKTTLAEALLYLTGSIRKAGRVDHGDAYLDTHQLEKKRGITIFAKQANLMFGKVPVTLLDTPGHVDFSAEMERTLQVLDYAILVISGRDGVQGHVQTLWRLLKQYRVPTFIFVNKMDQSGTNREEILLELKQRLGEGCVAMPDLTDEASLSESFLEETAVLDEVLTERFLDGIMPGKADLSRLVQERKLFPCLFGSALHMQGIEELVKIMEELMRYPEYPEAFGARVYKIGRSGADRLTYLKVTGGTLRVRQLIGEEKINQIRLYSGNSAQMLQEAPAGSVVAVTGLTTTFAGQGLGCVKGITSPVLEPVLSYAVVLPEGTDLHQVYGKLKEIGEEIPELHLSVSEGGLLHAQVMGEVQMEILKTLILERIGMEIAFDEGQIVYRETITKRVEGVGHFEPLRHYAEVHLVMESAPPGSGLTFKTACPPDTLDANWQNLILTHLYEKTYRGVLTASPITDMTITLVSGRAHLKHTEGGDFREATYRAVRHGLMKAREMGAAILLEPIYAFELAIPDRCIGRAMNDIQSMQGSFGEPEPKDGCSILRGTAPVAAMRNYAREVTAYTSGEGRLTLQFAGYAPCQDAEEIIERYGYDPEADVRDPAGSVFCSHGAGVYVPWQEVEDYMHLPLTLRDGYEETAEADLTAEATLPRRGGRSIPADIQDDAELKAIFERTYGSIRQERAGWSKSSRRGQSAEPVRRGSSAKEKPSKPACMLVDGYNIIFAWEELQELAKDNMDGARMRLMEILSNYQGYRKMTLILVFDAYKVAGGTGEDFKHHNIYVVYTKEAETADTYIERTVHEMANRYEITVATSDGAEQAIIFGEGARRMSAGELYEEIQSVTKEIRREYLAKTDGKKVYLFDDLDEKQAELFEDVRLGKKDLEGHEQGR